MLTCKSIRERAKKSSWATRMRAEGMYAMQMDLAPFVQNWISLLIRLQRQSLCSQHSGQYSVLLELCDGIFPLGGDVDDYLTLCLTSPITMFPTHVFPTFFRSLTEDLPPLVNFDDATEPKILDKQTVMEQVIEIPSLWKCLHLPLPLW